MNLELPDGANVQIFIGGGAPPSVVGNAAMPPLLDTAVVRPRRRLGRRLLGGTAALALLVVAFSLGQHSIGAAPRPQVASNAALPAPQPAAPAEQHAFPDRPLPRELAQGSDDQVPAAFQRQLQQAPTVVPPPGQPARPANGNPFGLEN